MSRVLSFGLLLAASAAASDPASGPGWELAAQEEGISVSTRVRAGSAIREVKAEALVDATPASVWRVIRDYESYTRTMPYTQVSRVVGKDDARKIIYVYSVVNPPLVARRDYALRITDDSRWEDGKGFFKSSWTLANHRAPPPSDEMVRILVNDGYFLLRPHQDGKRTRVTYYLYTDPGGSVPRFIANMANTSAVPDVFRAIRREVVARSSR